MGERICSVDGCGKRLHARGWCSMHYHRWLHFGSLDLPEQPPKPTCSVDDCDRPTKGQGLCNKHYTAARRTTSDGRTCSVTGCSDPLYAKTFCVRHYNVNLATGQPVSRLDWPLDERLKEIGWDVTARGCWEWRGKRDAQGYGMLSARRIGVRDGKVHRLVWELANERPIPEGLVVRHKCDNPPCCRPDHLEVGTQADNNRDMHERGRSASYANGAFGSLCKNGIHDITRPGALRVTRVGGVEKTQCVECYRLNSLKGSLAYQARKRKEKSDGR